MEWRVRVGMTGAFWGVAGALRLPALPPGKLTFSRVGKRSAPTGPAGKSLQSQHQLAFELRIQQRHVQPHQPHAAPGASLIPGFFGGRDQVIFIKARPDVLLGRQLEIVKLEFDALPRDAQVGFNLREPQFQLRVQALDNRLALGQS